MSDQAAENEVLAVLRASPARRAFGVVTMAILGILLIFVALNSPPENILALLFLVMTGAGALWLADRMRRATGHALELTRTELRSSSGERLALVDDIVAVERGTFAFKPSSGFTLKLKTPAARRWQPGLWWRLGAKLGVGGMTSRGQAKAMADSISAMYYQEYRSRP
ncbi:hypothetical protein [Roseovarius sp. EL26]|uniref:hypothetical protein n=1 Tax=Roseovarius sp. EL26 TaxID=2126672 RepID=UPI000EA1749E|nr:hypothetical protein [Roseovarius sp. EL26]